MTCHHGKMDGCAACDEISGLRAELDAVNHRLAEYKWAMRQAWSKATAAERERAAKVCETLWESGYQYAPGEWSYGLDVSALDCAAAIRSGNASDL
jgi:hypothetical protein